MGRALCALAAAALLAPVFDREAAFFDAAFELRVEAQPALAASRLRALLEDSGLAPEERARALLELARAELLLGDLDASRARLVEIAALPIGARVRVPGTATLAAELASLAPADPAPPTAQPSIPPPADPLPEPEVESEFEPDPSPPTVDAEVVPWPPFDPPPALPAMAAEELEARAAELDARAAAWRAHLPGASVAALLGRTCSHDRSDDRRRVYDLATFSFEHDTRDDRARVRNDWDLQFGSGRRNRFHVNMTGGDDSTCEDLGPRPDSLWTEVVAEPGSDEAHVLAGHTYRIHSRDRDTDAWFVLQVLEVEPAEWVVFRWRELDPKTR